jgi:hypothetical protein
MSSRLGRYIVSATNITANYKPGKFTLTADAEVPPFVHDVSFERDIWFGGLKFDLGGSFGAPEVGPTRIERVEKTFDITLSELVTPSHYCLVVIQGYPNGVPVLITGWPPEDAGTDGTGQKPQWQIDSTTGDTINVVVNTSFLIRQVLGELNITSSINVTYDKEYVKLLASRIDGTSIVWEFEAIKIGNTDITVGVGSRQPPFFYIVRHDVIITGLKN